MLKVGVGCTTFLALVEVEDPARSIKLPKTSTARCIAWCHQSLLCHSSWGRYKCARNVLANSGAVEVHGCSPEGVLLQRWNHSPWVTPLPELWMNVPVGHVAERNIQLTLGATCYSLAVNLDLEGFTLVLVCRTMSYGAGSSVGEGTGHIPTAPRAAATSSHSSAHNQWVQIPSEGWTVAECPQIFQRFDYSSYTNFVKLYKFFLRLSDPSHPHSIQTALSHHTSVYKPGQTTAPCTVCAQCYMGCQPLSKAWSKSELRKKEEALNLKQNQQKNPPTKQTTTTKCRYWNFLVRNIS